MWFNLMGWTPGPESETRKPAPSASSWIRRSSRSRNPGDLLSPEHVQGPGASLEGRLDRHITPAWVRCLATWPPTAFGQPHRHGVADLPGHGTETAGELEVHRERLKAGRLTDADGAILLGVPEAAVRIADAPGREPGSGPVPGHAAVDIAVSCGVFVAFQPEFVRPVPVPAALSSGAMRFRFWADRPAARLSGIVGCVSPAAIFGRSPIQSRTLS